MSSSKKGVGSGFRYIVMGLAMGALLFSVVIGGMLVLLRGY